MAGSRRGNPWIFPIILTGLAVGVLGAMGWQRWQRLHMPVHTAPPSPAPVRHAPASGTHAVIDAAGYLLGGWNDGDWVSAREMAPNLTGKERYRLYTLTGFIGEARGSRAKPDETTDVGITLSPEFTPQDNEEVIGIAGDWDALPRVPNSLPTKDTELYIAVRQVLDRNHLPDAPVHITQALRVDLDGDGHDETLISATVPRPEYPDTATQAGDYSLVLLERREQGRMDSSVLSGQYIAQAGTGELPLAFSVAGVLDVNGDGIQEIIVNSRYYEGGGKTVFSLNHGAVEGAFANNWGL